MARTATGARERIVASTLMRLRMGGLSAAGLADIVADADAPRGSLYHYFPGGKNQLVAEAIEVYRATVADLIVRALSSGSPLRQRIKRLFRLIDERMAASRYAQSCAVGAVVLDLRANDDALRAACRGALDLWAQVAARHLVELPVSARLGAGRTLVTLIEGAQLQARAARSGRSLDEACELFTVFIAGTVERTARR